jgi:hypothetical protein
VKEVALLLLVLDLHGQIRIAKSGELTVIERITIEAREGASGLSRELPPGSKIVDVVRNGHPEPWVLDGRRLRVGAAPLAKGRHRYEITYRSLRQVHFLDQYDELRWSIGGLAMERVTAEIILPVSVPRHELRVRTEHESFVRDGRAAFRSRKPLTGKESLGFTLRFPKGVVTPPGVEQRARWWWDDYRGLLGVLVLLLGAAAVLLHLRAAAR